VSTLIRNRSRSRAPIGSVAGSVALSLVAVAVSTALVAQQPVTLPVATDTTQGGQMVTRSELQARLDSLRSAGDSQAAARVEQRLQRGDLQPGDVLQVQVWGDSSFSGNYVVSPQRTIQIQGLTEVDLHGVLYSEADSAVAKGLQEILRSPRVRVQSLTRVAVLGAVKNPGFYDLQPTSSVADALMVAGGPQQSADVNNMQLVRNGENVLPDKEPGLTTMTLADLGVQRGDQLLVPAQGHGLSLQVILGGLGALIGLTYGITRLIRGR